MSKSERATMSMLKNRRQSGQALVTAAFGLVALIGATGLAIDVGYLRYQRRLVQSAADSAAIAGAAELQSGNWSAAALQDSSLNGFTDGIADVTVTANTTTFNGKQGVKVQVSAVRPTFFVRIFGVHTASIAAGATAIMGSNGLSNCMYILGQGAGGITTNGTAGISAPNCGIIDNDDLRQNGSGTITAASIGLAGALNAHGSGSITPNPVSGIVPAADPLSYLARPSTGGACQAGTVSDPQGKNDPGQGGDHPVFSPGHYCNGIDISGKKDVLFNPGTYVITSNGINFSGNGTVTGNGVTFYFSAGGGSINFSGTQDIHFSAPTTGQYAGILFFQNEANTTGAKLDGANGSQFNGSLYFPNANLTINGAAGLTNAYMIVVAKALTLNGGTLNISANYSELANGSPIKNAVLVE